MKKIILFFFGVSMIYSFLFSQNISLSHQYGNITNGDTVQVFLSNEEAIEYHIYVKNNSTQDMGIKVKKYVYELLPGAFNSFCWGSCFSPTVDESPNSIVIPMGITNKNDFYADYSAMGQDGISLVAYTFFNETNASDSANLFILFHSSPLSVNKYLSKNSSISLPFPNPASSFVKFTYDIPYGVNDARIIMKDITGNVVKNITLSNGEGQINIDVQALSSGIYFYSLVVENVVGTTRKILIQR
jgi:hypothetical protein